MSERDLEPEDLVFLERVRAVAHARDERDGQRAEVLASEVLQSLREQEREVGPPGGTWAERARVELAQSPILRILAASVLVHLLALPAVAWYVLRPEPAPQLTIRIEPGPASAEPAAEATEEFSEAAVGDPGVPGLTAEDARRLDRLRLDRSESLPGRAQGPSDRESARHWFEMRVAALDGAERLRPSDLELDPEDPLARLALVEFALDQHLRRPEEGLAGAIVERQLRRLDAVVEIGALGDALEAARARAVRYGLRTPESVEPATALLAGDRAFDVAPRAWLMRLDEELASRGGWDDLRR